MACSSPVHDRPHVGDDLLGSRDRPIGTGREAQQAHCQVLRSELRVLPIDPAQASHALQRGPLPLLWAERRPRSGRTRAILGRTRAILHRHPFPRERAYHDAGAGRVHEKGGRVLFVHEVHKVVGKTADRFEDAYRDEWMPALGSGSDARLLWYFDLAHGSGLAYRAVTVTAVADGAAWARLAERVAGGDLQPWARRLDSVQHESQARIMAPLEWSPSIGQLSTSRPTRSTTSGPCTWRTRCGRFRGRSTTTSGRPAASTAAHSEPRVRRCT